MRRQLFPAMVMVLVFTAVTGVAYPLVMTGVGHALFPGKVEGSLVKVDGRLVGSRWIGQPFTRPEYFHPRPSDAGGGYDPRASSGSNKGPTNKEFLAEVQQRIVGYRTENGLADDAAVPVDAVTASASGLDPEISVANALLQAGRVARARGESAARVRALIQRHTDRRGLGFLGEPGVNVLELNLALDANMER